MPAPTGYTVQMPWSSQSGSTLDPEVLNDYHNVDGWDLVYNSFSPTTVPTKDGQTSGGLYFALYNKFRGILRFYMYIPPGYFGSSTGIKHGLAPYNDSGKLLNYEGVDIVDANVNLLGFTQGNTKSVASTGGWYYMQYKMAYDPTVKGSNFPSKGLEWDTYNSSISDIYLDGRESGSLKGSVTTPKPDKDIVAETVNGVLLVAEIAAMIALPGDAPIVLAAEGGAAGSTAGFFSAVLAKNSDQTQTVDLTMNSVIKTTGTAITGQEIAYNFLVLPGQNPSSNGDALTSSPFGVFSIRSRPVVRVHTDIIPQAPNDNGPVDKYTYSYTWDTAGNRVEDLIDYNPDVININDPSQGQATRSDFKAEIIMFDPTTTSAVSVENGNHETVGTYSVYSLTNGPLLISESVNHNNGGNFQPTNQKAAIRVSFKVNPKNGAPSVFIVQTFLADIVAQ